MTFSATQMNLKETLMYKVCKYKVNTVWTLYSYRFWPYIYEPLLCTLVYKVHKCKVGSNLKGFYVWLICIYARPIELGLVWQFVELTEEFALLAFEVLLFFRRFLNILKKKKKRVWVYVVKATVEFHGTTTIKLRAVDQSTIQFWTLLAKGHST